MGITEDLKQQGEQLSKNVEDLIDKAKDKLADGLPDDMKDKAERLIDKAVDALPENLTEKIEGLADKAKGLLGGIGEKSNKDAPHP
jgi:predicted transcriptional regulator